MVLCGPKLSLCCLLLSAWGVIQLGLMGIFFSSKAVALVDDIPLMVEYGVYGQGEPEKDRLAFNKDVDMAYSQAAFNCWVAACLYVVTFLISAHQFHTNNKTSS